MTLIDLEDYIQGHPKWSRDLIFTVIPILQAFSFAIQ